MTKPKGFYTDEQGRVRPITGKQPHVKPLSKGTARLRIPKRTIKKKRAKGFSKLTRVTSKKQAVYGHSITHSPRYQKSVLERMGKTKGEAFLNREHDFLVRHYLTNHDSPLKIVSSSAQKNLTSKTRPRSN